ncbi:MAG: hypothetical protein ABI699_19710, partial [Caldimonas sp.]
VIVDLVESVRLMRENEEEVIGRWIGFVEDVRLEVLPLHHGRLVKSLGDGLLLEFLQMREAIAACLHIQTLIAPYNAGKSADSVMQLRLGAHAADVVVDELDVYGSGVNLAARLAGLALPGTIVVSDEVRDAAVAGLDAEVEDLGECFLKHIELPVRAWKILPPHHEQAVPAATQDLFRASMAVLPFAAREGDLEASRLGDVFADDLTQALARHAECRVVSRLSTVALSGRNLPPRELFRLLGARYVVSGLVERSGPQFEVELVVRDVASGDTIWSARPRVDVKELLGSDERIAQVAARDIHASVLGLELRSFVDAPFTHMHGYSALLGCIAFMHKMARPQAERARQGLEHLIERFPRTAEPYAWQAKWLMLRVAQGWSDDAALDTRKAKAAIARSLEMCPHHSLALAIDGQIALFADGDRRRGIERLQLAIDHNPNESLAWLFYSNALVNEARVPDAIASLDRANSLAPLDPLKFLFDNLSSYALLVAGRHQEAHAAAVAAVRGNRQHLPTYPILIVAEMLVGHEDEARRHASEFLRMHPAMSTAAYAARHRGPRHFVDLSARLLRDAGLPA